MYFFLISISTTSTLRLVRASTETNIFSSFLGSMSNKINLNISTSVWIYCYIKEIQLHMNATIKCIILYKYTMCTMPEFHCKQNEYSSVFTYFQEKQTPFKSSGQFGGSGEIKPWTLNKSRADRKPLRSAQAAPPPPLWCSRIILGVSTDRKKHRQ